MKTWCFGWGLVLGLLIGSANLCPCHAQEHEHNGHPPQDQAIHEQFYQTWMRPDLPDLSCCGKEDCYPTVIKLVGGVVHMALRRKMPSGELMDPALPGSWFVIPEDKLESNRKDGIPPRDSPDGRSHVCASVYESEDGRLLSVNVFCAVEGVGM